MSRTSLYAETDSRAYRSGRCRPTLKHPGGCSGDRVSRIARCGFLGLLLVVQIVGPRCAVARSLRVEVYSESIFRQPEEFNTRPLPYSPDFLQTSIALYQRFLSHSSCQFIPSCSRYSYLCSEELGYSEAIVRTFERLYRCNPSARTRYPVYAGYLVDLPGFLRPDFAHTPPEPADAERGRTDYGLWLLDRGEWRAAYDHYLREQFLAARAEHRVRLSLAAINLGDWASAWRWVESDTSGPAGILAALALYRGQRYGSSLERSERVLRNSQGAPLERIAAILVLSATLRLPEGYDASRIRRALRVLPASSDSALYGREIEDACERPSGWPSATASLVPGLGQALNGFAQDGLVALGATALLGCAARSSFLSGNSAGGLFFGTLFGYAYAANILAGWSAPDRRQRETRDRLLRSLRAIYDPDRGMHPSDVIDGMEAGRELAVGTHGRR